MGEHLSIQLSQVVENTVVVSHAQVMESEEVAVLSKEGFAFK